ncbi:sigma 54-interacting transcriptional regulator [bacterium]|nr:sigma 54-interacting transcriptional regulator [bacterium]
MDPAPYKQLFEFGKRLLTEKDVNRLLTVAMDMAIEISGAERGWIILCNEANQDIRFQTARNLQKTDIENPEFETSRTIIDKVRAQGKPVCLQNALDDSAFKESKSIESLKVLSVICLPLIRDNRIFGVVYLDNRKITGVFKPDIFDFIQEFTNFVATAAFSALERQELQNQISDLEKELRGKYRFDHIIGQHPKILEILQMVSQVADTPATVLIQGESGTGKELIARALHHNSSRKEKPFIAVNCAALPEQLLESELFGHVKGAFTGAVKDRPGWFEKADCSTIFLDEINDMSSALQARLLRVLQTGDYSRVGSSEIQHCDVRVVAATSKDIQKMIKEGLFREELYYRLNVINLWLPPLRDRKSDIPLLVQHFLNLYKDKYNKPDLKFSPQAEMLLMNYDFPGNIRELENMIQRTVILTKDPVIQPQHLPIVSAQHEEHVLNEQKLLSLSEHKRRESDRTEKNAVIRYLMVSSGHISRAAKLAGVDVSNFHKLIKKHNIDPKAYKQK